MSRPNFIFICTDQQRSDSLGCAGNPVARSPNIDSIAQNGARFTRHITPMQICSPSRATMLTGLYPRNHRLVMNGMALPPSVTTLTGLLSDSGYRTHGVGKQHLQPLLAPAEYNMPDSRAFWDKAESEEWDGPYYGYQSLDLLLGESDTAFLAGHYASWLKQNFPESMHLLEPASSSEPLPADLDEIWSSAMPVEQHYNTWITNRSVEFLQHQSAAEDPFFLFVSYPDPHHPFDPPAAYANRWNPADMPIPTVDPEERGKMPPYHTELYPQGGAFRELYWAGRSDLEAGSMITTDNISDGSMQKAIAYTYAMIEMIDDGVGRILNALSQSGQQDNTYIIFTSDHGELLGDHGLLHKGPPSYRQLTEVAMLVKGPGISPGITIDALTNHIDIAPTITDLADIARKGQDFDGESMCPLLSGDQSTIREFNFGEYHPSAREDLYNQTVQSEKWRLTLYPQRPEWGELFDLENDPHERNNIYTEESNRDVIAKLSNVLATRFPPQPVVDNQWICKW